MLTKSDRVDRDSVQLQVKESAGAGMHRCVLGCLECLRACPANPELPVEETSLCFTAADIDCLLSRDVAGAAETSAGIQSKLA